jgi:hypothetical protein
MARIAADPGAEYALVLSHINVQNSQAPYPLTSLALVGRRKPCPALPYDHPICEWPFAQKEGLPWSFIPRQATGLFDT